MSTLTKIKLSLLGLAPLIAQGVLAQPAIDSSSLDITDFGVQVTVKGSEFGAGPRVVLFDTFSEAEVPPGGNLPTLEPVVGKWLSVTGTGYVKRRANSEDEILVVRDSTKESPSRLGLDFGIEDSEGLHDLEHFQEFYVSYSVKDFGDFPGSGGTTTSFSDVSSSKNAWVMFGNRGDNTSYSVSKGIPAGHDMVLSSWTGGAFATAGNNTRLRPSMWHGGLTSDWAFQDWNTINFHAKLNPNEPYGDAEGFIEYINKNNYKIKHREGNLMSDQTEQGVPYPYWDRIKFFAWDRYTESNVLRAADNIYVAIGPHSNARVILTDQPTLADSTSMVHLAPTSWTESAITASIPNIPANANYLHVIDSRNRVSNSIVLCRECPVAPQLKIQGQ